MNSFYFGPERRMFGTYHAANGARLSQGVAVCPPLFHEYYRCHFMMRRLADALAAKGYDVLRFDYVATGDSKGNYGEAEFADWSNNVSAALAELRSRGGYDTVSVVAIRAAAMLALPWEHEVERFGFWDPVLDPVAFVDELRALNEATLAQHHWLSGSERQQIAEVDYLGTGQQRAVVEESLAAFAEAPGKFVLPEGAVVVQTEMDWISGSLEMVYPHDVISKLETAF